MSTLANDAFADDVAAREAATADDVRCIISLLASSTPENSETNQTAMLYFLGKLEGRAPDANLEPLLVSGVDNFDPMNVSADLIRCGGEIVDKGAKMKTIGQKLVDRSKAAPSSDQPAPDNP